MEILAAPNSPYGNPKDRTFKTVPAAMRFMIRSFYEQVGVARHVGVYDEATCTLRIDFKDKDELVLTTGSVEGWKVGETKTLEEAIVLTKKYHRA